MCPNYKHVNDDEAYFCYIQSPTREHQVFFPVLQVHFLRTNKFLPEHIEYFSLSSKSIHYVQINSYQNTSCICPVLQVFSPVFQVHFLRTVPTRTYQVFALSSKYFFLSSKSIFYLQIPTGTRQVFPPVLQVFFRILQVLFQRTDSYQNRSNILPCPPSPFSTYKFVPEQIKYFALSSKYFSYVQFLPEQIKYFSLSSKYFPLSLKTIWRQLIQNNYRILT